MARSSLLFGLLGGICNCTGLLGSGAASGALPFRSSPLTLSLASFLAPPSSIRLFRVRSQPQSGSRSVSQMEDEADCYTFGPYKIHCTEVFHSTPHSYAMVNLRPLVPDVLVCPRREVKRFIDLTAEEVCDLWLTAKKIGGPLEHYHKASSLTFAIQDGPQAGQTVPHVHIHILPRKKGDFEKNDEIYDAIDMKEKELKEKLDLDRERKDRTSYEMAQEADKYRALFP